MIESNGKLKRGITFDSDISAFGGVAKEVLSCIALAHINGGALQMTVL